MTFIKLILSLALVGLGIFCGYVSYSTQLVSDWDGKPTVSLGAVMMAFSCVICCVIGFICTVATVVQAESK